ncbi:hypothetical protein HN51_045713 [Arachis hypogaea]|uniref:SCP domain-containing protein n=2 Tax=Arachis TaxID=3817 RepID=A0A444XXB6_ARAHY|nr:pathogenesis-related protein PRB1-3-like [Arachis hypogaea]RYQ94439.1 hypothetical protein Ahy_B08g089344 [Arachis hypogaea]
MKRLLKILVVLLKLLSVAPLSLLAQNLPRDYLEIHNNARASVGVGPLKWEPMLEMEAYEFLHQHIVVFCSKEVPVARYVSMGHNIARELGSKNFSGIDAVRTWVAQKKNYNHTSNSCVGGECRGYTQVVWKTTTHVGCARVMCDNKNAGIVVSCVYFPPGNIPALRPY